MSGAHLPAETSGDAGPTARAVQVQALESNLETAKLQNQELLQSNEKMKESMAKMKQDHEDLAKKDTLRFHILLDMFGLQLLQTQEAAETEAVMKQ